MKRSRGYLGGRSQGAFMRWYLGRDYFRRWRKFQTVTPHQFVFQFALNNQREFKLSASVTHGAEMDQHASRQTLTAAPQRQRAI